MRAWLIMLMPYFGRWPEWINLFIETCKWNPDVRWRFYTDCGEPENKAANVDYVHLSFDAYKALVRERLRIDFDPADPYKLCDARPAYGQIHARDIAGHRFYGWGDIDLFYGQIGNFYTRDLLARSNVLSVRDDMVTGHFAVLRNNWMLRNAYRRIPGYLEALAQPVYREMDERGFYRVFRRPEGESTTALQRLRDRVDPCRRGLVLTNLGTTVFSPKGWIDGSMNYPRRWFWKDGRLTHDHDADRDFLCLHFMRWKADKIRPPGKPKMPDEGAWMELPAIMQGDWRQLAAEGFCISAAGITPLR